MKPKVDKNKCIGCGICVGVCPEGMKMVDGKAEIKDENAECLKDAASSCPKGAIILNSGIVKSTVGKLSETIHNFGHGTMQGRRLGYGRGRGGFGAGSTGKCICPNCGYRTPHQRGVPCYTQKCPKCGTNLVRR